jgi:hypothetical protein
VRGATCVLGFLEHFVDVNEMFSSLVGHINPSARLVEHSKNQKVSPKK